MQKSNVPSVSSEICLLSVEIKYCFILIKQRISCSVRDCVCLFSLWIPQLFRLFFQMNQNIKYIDGHLFYNHLEWIVFHITTVSLGWKFTLLIECNHNFLNFGSLGIKNLNKSNPPKPTSFCRFLIVY